MRKTEAGEVTGVMLVKRYLGRYVDVPLRTWDRPD